MPTGSIPALLPASDLTAIAPTEPAYLPRLAIAGVRRFAGRLIEL
jgi:hypothetical protein